MFVKLGLSTHQGVNMRRSSRNPFACCASPTTL